MMANESNDKVNDDTNWIFDEKVSLYTFNDSDIGILTVEYLHDTFVFGNKSIYCNKIQKIKKEEYHLISQFQVLFFALFPNYLDEAEYKVPDYLNKKYLAVPIMKTSEVTGKINFRYLKSLVLVKTYPVTAECFENNKHPFLWINCIKKFYIGQSLCPFELDDRISDKYDDPGVRNFITKGKFNNKTTFRDYFEKLYSIQLKSYSNKHSLLYVKSAKDSMFVKVRDASIKHNLTPPNSHNQNDIIKDEGIMVPTEITLDSGLTDEILKYAGDFVLNFSVFLISVNVWAFEKKFSLGFNPTHTAEMLVFGQLMNCSTLRNSTLGNILTKCFFTIHYTFTQLEEIKDVHSHQWPSTIIKKIMDRKSKAMSNANIAKIVDSCGISHFFIDKNYFNYFLIPKIPDLKERIPDRLRVFLDSNSIEDPLNWNNPFQRKIFRGDAKKDVKTSAKVFNSIASQLYIESGLDDLQSFFKNTKIILVPDEKDKGNDNPESGNKNKTVYLTSFPCYKNYFKNIGYCKIILPGEIGKIERLIHYVFKDKALLEKCFVHQTMSRGLFTDGIFEVCEAIGDSVLDLVVVEDLMSVKNVKSHTDISQMKMNLVSNATLSKLLRYSGLFNFYKMSKSARLTPKYYGDICEALLGAVFIDMGGDFETFFNYFNNWLGDTCAYYAKN